MGMVHETHARSEQVRIAIVDYGINNVGSVATALRRVGALPVVATHPRDLADAAGIVLPGVGAFDAGMRQLRESGQADALMQYAHQGIPVLGICLGMHLLTKGSEEGSLPGLGLIDGVAQRLRFDASRPMSRVHDPAPDQPPTQTATPPTLPALPLKVPHMGWNTTTCHDADLFHELTGAAARFYYVHSYHVVCNQKEEIAATCDYGGTVVSAIRRGRLFATQFHPEKSHRFGIQVFANFVRIAQPSATPC